MASLFFQDYEFPSELYNKDTGDFTTPIRTLLDFTPHILQELPKQEKDQKPIHSAKEDDWTKESRAHSSSFLGSLLTAERASAITEYILKFGHEYLKNVNEKNRQEESFKRFENEYKKAQRKRSATEEDLLYSSTDEQEEQEIQRMKQKAKKNKKKESAGSSTLVKSAAAAGMLSISLFSSYQASVQFSEITFHNQLELLISQVKSILQSTEVWIQEHDKMEDEVPKQVRQDVIDLNQLLDLLVRLDPRSNKRVEAAGWGFSAIGGLSALGGVALGSATAVTGGAALVVGGAIAMVASKASGKSQLGARLLLENQVREKVSCCQHANRERQRVIQQTALLDELPSPSTSLPKQKQKKKQPIPST